MDQPHVQMGVGNASTLLPIRLLNSTLLRGCNIHHGATVLSEQFDLGNVEGAASTIVDDGFAGRFIKRFQGLRRRVPGSDFYEGFLDRLNAPLGASIEEILMEAILAVETAVAFERGHLASIAFARIEREVSAQKIRLIRSCQMPRLSRLATEVSLMGMIELLPEDLRAVTDLNDGCFEVALAEILRQARRQRLAPTTSALVLAAEKRGIPCESLGGPRLRVGQGAQQQHIFASVTSNTSFWACRLSADKRRTGRRLAELGLPVPPQIKVATADQARSSADKLGYPIVIKPLRGKKGGAVTAGIRDPDHIEEAFQTAQEMGLGVIVESFVEGEDHRILVIDGRFVAAVKRTPPAIRGDGQKTIEDLVNALNDDPNRDDFRMMKVKIDATLIRFLDKAGHTLDDVPKSGETILLRSTANGSTGGIFTDVTDHVHDDNKAMALRAAKAVDLDIAGVDFLTSDICRSYKEVGGSIIEINARPGLRPHTWPSQGKPRDVAGAMLNMVLGEGSSGRIPTALVAGDRGTGPAARDLDAILRGAGWTVGLATRNGTHLNGDSIIPKETQQRRAVRNLLRDPRVEALISTVSLRQTVKNGLAFDACEVAAVMNRSAEGNEALFRQGLDVLIKATHGKLVVSANNTMALEAAAAALGPDRLILVSSRLRGAVIERHLADGGAAVLKLWSANHDRIVLYHDDKVMTALPTNVLLPGASGRNYSRLTEARMLAVALAYGMGLSGQEIEAAVRQGVIPVPPLTQADHRSKSAKHDENRLAN